jgi:adenosylmethionine-8-amino-7-oxononanoate aminotransferase
MKRSEAEKLVEIAKEYMWPTFARDSSYWGRPLSIIESAEGRHVVDIFGNRLIESNGCGGAAPLGFNLSELMDAVIAQLKKINTTTPQFFSPCVPVPLLAQRIAEIGPEGMKYTIFSSNGTDANEAALKIARQYWKIVGKSTKYKTLHRFPGDYHGTSLGTASASGHPFRRKAFEPLPGGFVAFPAPNCYRCHWELAYPQCKLRCAEELKRVIEFEDPSTIALFITEITNTGWGNVLSPPGYAKRVREICDQYEILMSVDEVITGFGKTGWWFECQKEGIVPDMIAMGKGIAWGCGPLAGTHVKNEIYEVFTGKDALEHGYTFGSMGYLAAAGLAGIEYVEKHKLLDRVKEIGRVMAKELTAIKDQSKVVGDVRVNGILGAVEFVKNRKTKEVFTDRAAVAATVRQAGFENGVFLGCSTWYGDLINLMLPYTITDDELAQVFKAIKAAVFAVEKEHL